MNQFRALLAAADTMADAATAAATGDDSAASHTHGGQQLSQVFSGSSVGSAGYAAARGGATSSSGGCNQGAVPLLATHDSSCSTSSNSGSSDPQQADVKAAAAQLHRLAVNSGSTSGAAADDGRGQEQACGAGVGDNNRSNSPSPSSSSSRPDSPFMRPGLVATEAVSAAADSSSSSSRGPLSIGAIQGPLELLGELMLQAHASYTTCGLGSDGTNRLVNIVRQHMMDARRAGLPPALYGAKITGGGSGGTVCVLGLAGSAGQAAVDAVAAQYREETGYQPFVFAGSSMGAVAFKHLRIKLRKQPVVGVQQ